MTTIFEGTINGTKYTNATKYSEALEEAKKTGNYEASCSYREVFDCTADNKEATNATRSINNKEQIRLSNSKPTPKDEECWDQTTRDDEYYDDVRTVPCNTDCTANMFPCFGTGTNFTDYIDLITKSDVYSTDKIQFEISEMDNYLQDCEKNIIKSLDSFKKDSIKSYINNVDDVLNILKDYMNVNNSTIKAKLDGLDSWNKSLKEAEKNIDKLQTELDKLQIAKDELIKFNEFYKNIKYIASNKVEDKNNCTKKDLNNKSDLTHRYSKLDELLKLIFD